MFRFQLFNNAFVILLLFATQLVAQTDEQVLTDWTKNNEKQLIEKYKIIQSDWFEEECLLLANKMEFNKLDKCKLFQSEHINAYVFDNGHVYFSLALMQQIRNKHQWASILAHENAHIELHHYLKSLKKIKKPGVFFPKSKIKKTLKKHEKQADLWAQQRLDQFGFDTTQIYYFLQRVKDIKGSVKSHTHSKLSRRIKKTGTKEINNQTLISNIQDL
ncbi:MAG: M48 family metalloprotease [Alcanivoracaceae bacterium]|nr:M48 family metalloprotease [Alcanivoracaceae bacterium]